jgi:toxin-antitoxin system PIN domain toxin
MKIVDLNVLLYALNKDAHHHETVRHWWEAAIDGDEPIGLCWLVVLGLLRLATNPRVFPKPLTADQACQRVDAWLSHANTCIVTEAEEHWRHLRSLLEQSGTAANLTSDAHLAALAISYGAVLISCDTDFARFPRLRWENPLMPGRST